MEICTCPVVAGGYVPHRDDCSYSPRKLLEKFFKPEALPEILKRPMKRFGGLNCNDLIAQGRGEEAVAEFEKFFHYECSG